MPLDLSLKLSDLGEVISPCKPQLPSLLEGNTVSTLFDLCLTNSRFTISW